MKSVIPSYTKHTSCLENILCIILRAENMGLNVDVRMLFIDHWRMNYHSEEGDLGDKTKFFDDVMIEKLFSNFEEYYGMQCVRDISRGSSFNSSEVVKLLDQFDYLILCIDAFELKNLSLYQKWHVPHYVLVTSSQSDGIHCLDYAEEIFVEQAHFNRGALHYVGVVSGQPVRPEDLWAKDLYNRILKISQERAMFSNIKAFVRDLDDTDILYRELNEIPKNDVLLLRLPNSLSALGASRYHFGRCAERVLHIPYIAQLVREEFSNISEIWFYQIKKVVKFKFSRKESIIAEIQDTVLVLAEKEENLAFQLLEMLKKDGIS